MPPASAKKESLTAEQIDTIRRWIDQGAKFNVHWAYVKPGHRVPPVKDRNGRTIPLTTSLPADTMRRALSLLRSRSDDAYPPIVFDLTGLAARAEGVELSNDNSARGV